MNTDANPYRFGDLLALARQSWVHRMAAELENRGFADYRLTDAATLRRLRRVLPRWVSWACQWA